MIDYWSPENNVTKKYMENFDKFLRVWQNGSADIDALKNSEYGKILGYRHHMTYLWENPMDPEEIKWYAEQGIRKEMFETENFYTRWMLLTPEDMYENGNNDRKYPLVFVNHGGGNALEIEEFSTGHNILVAREGFMAAYLQNTNTDNILRVLSILEKKYPVDTERVYVVGYSQGGGKASDCAFRAPMKFAAHAPCGNDIYRYVDRFSVPYTNEEKRNLRTSLLPFMQVVGCCEHGNIVPLNNWVKNDGKRPGRVEGDIRTYPPRDVNADPTRPSDPNHKGGHVGPPEDADPRVWMVEQLNCRLDLLSCAPRNIDKCISYADTPEDELHHVLGFYGDEEKIETYYGYKHYTIDIWNKDNINAFRYVAVENSPHWPQVMLGELTWKFFKKFRRDCKSGKIIEDEYIYAK